MMIEFKGLSGFQELLEKLNFHRNSSDGESSDDDGMAQAQIAARRYIASLPYQILESIHPERIARRILEIPEDERVLISSMTADFLSNQLYATGERLPCTQLTGAVKKQNALYRFVSGWPLMPDRYSFSNTGWSDLPMLHWSRIEMVTRVSEVSQEGALLADYYRHAFYQLSDLEQNVSLKWLSCKMHPDLWVEFEERLLDTGCSNVPILQCIAEKVWKKLLTGDLMQ